MVILPFEQQVDVLDELVRDNRVEVNFTLATNGMVLQMIVIQIIQSTRSFTDSDTASSRLPVRTSSTMLDFFKHKLNADSRVRTQIHTRTYLHTHTTLILYLFIQCSGYDCKHIILEWTQLVCTTSF